MILKRQVRLEGNSQIFKWIKSLKFVISTLSSYEVRISIIYLTSIRDNCTFVNIETQAAICQPKSEHHLSYLATLYDHLGFWCSKEKLSIITTVTYKCCAVCWPFHPYDSSLITAPADGGHSSLATALAVSAVFCGLLRRPEQPKRYLSTPVAKPYLLVYNRLHDSNRPPDCLLTLNCLYHSALGAGKLNNIALSQFVLVFKCDGAWGETLNNDNYILIASLCNLIFLLQLFSQLNNV